MKIISDWACNHNSGMHLILSQKQFKTDHLGYHMDYISFLLLKVDYRREKATYDISSLPVFI